MRTSAAVPAGHFNDWPVDDKNAFVALLGAAYPLIRTGLSEVAAVHEAARAIGLDGGEAHWLADAVLGGVFNTFYLRGGDHYAEAGDLLKWGSAGDLQALGPDAVAWAREIAGAGSDH